MDSDFNSNSNLDSAFQQDRPPETGGGAADSDAKSGTDAPKHAGQWKANHPTGRRSSPPVLDSHQQVLHCKVRLRTHQEVLFLSVVYGANDQVTMAAVMGETSGICSSA
ncbi:hypothetical protein Salat_0129200 [Sesamum alatum]|uniref:Uncharacterized protein n=1 Tax=Sesamum alatum TaxID=300844 RepID=A0AAE1YX88_9LAMI|nr:hypothetical protein Salat_0129200 [Sesamum alatum]